MAVSVHLQARVVPADCRDADQAEAEMEKRAQSKTHTKQGHSHFLGRSALLHFLDEIARKVAFVIFVTFHIAIPARGVSKSRHRGVCKTLTTTLDRLCC